MFIKDQVEQLRLGILTPFSQVYGTDIGFTPGEDGHEDSSDVAFDGCYVTVTDVAGKTGYIGVSVAVMTEGDVEHDGQLFSNTETALDFIRASVAKIKRDAREAAEQ